MDPMTFLTALSLGVASVAGLAGALVSFQTFKDMRDIKKKLSERRYGQPVWPGPDVTHWDDDDDYD